MWDRFREKRIGRVACTLCDQYFMGNSVYVTMLGFIGTMITAFDIIRIMNYKFPSRNPSQSKSSDEVPVVVERDLKLMTSILGIEHYTLMVLGAITEYPMLYMPWLLMQLCVIIIEIVVFFIRLFLDGLHVKRDEIFLAMLAAHNWLQAETMYVSIMCFMTSFLSSIALEMGTRYPLGHSTNNAVAFNTFFHRSYNLKIKILATNVVSGIISTILVTLGEKYRVPYLYTPWLVNTIQGMALREGPALIGLAYVLLPEAGALAGCFLFLTLLLYVEEICLWNEVFASFRRCWSEYGQNKSPVTDKSKEKLIKSDKGEEAHLKNRENGIRFIPSGTKLREKFTEARGGSQRLISTSLDSSVASILSRFSKSTTDDRNHVGRGSFRGVTDHFRPIFVLKPCKYTG